MDSILKTVDEQELLQVCEKQLTSLGFRAVDVDVRVAGRSLVRVFIDRLPPGGQVESGSRSVSIDDCARISRELEPWLDHWQTVSGSYDLEVSSPGVERRLRLRADFEAVVGRPLRLSVLDDQGNKAKNPVCGKLLRIDGDVLVLSCGNNVERRFSLEKVIRAELVWESAKK